MTPILSVAFTGFVAAALTLTGTAAHAGAATEHGSEKQSDVNPNTQNPCTGALGDLVDDERDSWTVATRSDGSYLARGHAVVRVTFTPYDDDEESYAGHETFSSVERVTRGADGFRQTQRVRMTSPAGAVLLFTQSSHVVIGPDGEVRVDRESESFTCG